MNDEFVLAPTILSIAITLVFTSLLALVYLTMRSYRTSNHLNLENVLENPIGEATLDTQQAAETEIDELLKHHSRTLVPNSDLHLNPTITHHCLCQLDNSSGHQYPSPDSLQDTEKFFFNSMTYDLAKLGQIQNNAPDNFLYQAHSHHIGPLSYLCHTASESLITELPSSEKTDCSYSIYDQKPYQQLRTGCCPPVSIKTTSCDRNGRSRVDVVKNPLDLDDDQ